MSGTASYEEMKRKLEVARRQKEELAATKAEKARQLAAAEAKAAEEQRKREEMEQVEAELAALAEEAKREETEMKEMDERILALGGAADHTTSSPTATASPAVANSITSDDRSLEVTPQSPASASIADVRAQGGPYETPSATANPAVTNPYPIDLLPPEVTPRPSASASSASQKARGGTSGIPSATANSAAANLSTTNAAPAQKRLWTDYSEDEDVLETPVVSKKTLTFADITARSPRVPRERCSKYQPSVGGNSGGSRHFNASRGHHQRRHQQQQQQQQRRNQPRPPDFKANSGSGATKANPQQPGPTSTMSKPSTSNPGSKSQQLAPKTTGQNPASTPRPSPHQSVPNAAAQTTLSNPGPKPQKTSRTNRHKNRSKVNGLDVSGGRVLPVNVAAIFIEGDKVFDRKETTWNVKVTIDELVTLSSVYGSNECRKYYWSLGKRQIKSQNVTFDDANKEVAFFFKSDSSEMRIPLGSTPPAENDIFKLYQRLKYGGKVRLQFSNLEWAQGIYNFLACATPLEPISYAQSKDVFDTKHQFNVHVKRNVEGQAVEVKKALVAAFSGVAEVSFKRIGSHDRWETVASWKGKCPIGSDRPSVSVGQMFEFTSSDPSQRSSLGEGWTLMGQFTGTQAKDFNAGCQFKVTTQWLKDLTPANQPTPMPNNGVYLINPVVDETSFNRQINAVNRILQVDPRSTVLPIDRLIYGLTENLAEPKDIFLDEARTAMLKLTPPFDDQKAGVHQMLGSANFNFRLLLGPPGTGKTTSIAWKVIILLASGLMFPSEEGSILVGAPSNTAVDVLMARLLSIMDSGAFRNFRGGLEDINTGFGQAEKGTFSNAKNPASMFNLVRAHNAKDTKSVENKLDQLLEDEIDAELGDSVHKLPGFCLNIARNVRRYSNNADTIIAGDKYAKWYGCRTKLEAEERSEFAVAENEMRKLAFSNTDVCFSTISNVGSYLFDKDFDPKYIILDENTLATEAETWIPLSKFPFARLYILVGDNNQLSPVSLSPHGQTRKSMFERLLNIKWPHSWLILQHRMHQDISKMPNKLIYQGKLEDSPLALNRGPKFGELTTKLFGPDCQSRSVWMDVEGAKESNLNINGSPSNTKYAHAVARLLTNIFDELGVSKRDASEAADNSLRSPSIAVIAFYAGEVTKIKELVANNPVLNRVPNIVVGTVDSNQGAEADVVVIDTVRRNDNGKVGFVDDSGRLCVAFTRAKSLRIVVGDHSFFKRHKPAFVREKALLERMMQEEDWKVVGCPWSEQDDWKKFSEED